MEGYERSMNAWAQEKADFYISILKDYIKEGVDKKIFDSIAYSLAYQHAEHADCYIFEQWYSALGKVAAICYLYLNHDGFEEEVEEAFDNYRNGE